MLVQKARNRALVAPGGFEADVNLLRTFLQAGVGLFLEPVEEPAESIFGVRHSVGSANVLRRGFLLRSDQGDFKGGLAYVDPRAHRGNGIKRMRTVRSGHCFGPD